MSQVFLITGSSRGVGRAITEAALEAGHRVVATARRPEQLHDLAGRYGDQLATAALDVTDYEAAQVAVQTALDAFGRLDVVVNNAGYGDLASAEDVTLESFKAQVDTNFYGVVHLTKSVLPVMREQGSGHIFQVSSVGDRVGSAGLSAYQSAKWAVAGFSTALAQEVAPLGVKVTVLEPGGMRTDWAGSSMTIPPISEPYQQTVGVFAEWLRANTGTEETDPARVGRVVCDLAGRPDAPLRLVLGAHAYALALQAAEALATSDQQWRDLTESVSKSAVSP
jgi:NAD(P)-dependent dehydrogenase (short-subunit alcohol dehydrogenase family)